MRLDEDDELSDYIDGMSLFLGRSKRNRTHPLPCQRKDSELISFQVDLALTIRPKKPTGP